MATDWDRTFQEHTNIACQLLLDLPIAMSDASPEEATRLLDALNLCSADIAELRRKIEAADVGDEIIVEKAISFQETWEAIACSVGKELIEAAGGISKIAQ